MTGIQEEVQKTADAGKQENGLGAKLAFMARHILPSSLVQSLGLQAKPEAETLKLTPDIIQVTELMNDLLTLMKPAAEAKGVDFRIVSTNADVNAFVKVDSVKIVQIFANLGTNAIRVTPKGGVVELELRVLDWEGACSKVRFIISDNGCGMTESFIRNELFRPDAEKPKHINQWNAASDLGFWQVKRLVELMHGQLEVQSTVGQGTKIIINMDIERVEPVREYKNPHVLHVSSRAEQLLAGRHILLAEDHPLNAEMTMKILEEVGCKVIWAKNGVECLTLFQKDAPDIDLILMDIRMPIMDGIAATQAIRALTLPEAQTVPVVAVTASAYEEDILSSLAAGMNAHVTKPVDPNKLFEAMLKVLGE